MCHGNGRRKRCGGGGYSCPLSSSSSTISTQDTASSGREGGTLSLQSPLPSPRESAAVNVCRYNGFLRRPREEQESAFSAPPPLFNGTWASCDEVVSFRVPQPEGQKRRRGSNEWTLMYIFGHPRTRSLSPSTIQCTAERNQFTLKSRKSPKSHSRFPSSCSSVAGLLNPRRHRSLQLFYLPLFLDLPGAPPPSSGVPSSSSYSRFSIPLLLSSLPLPAPFPPSLSPAKKTAAHLPSSYPLHSILSHTLPLPLPLDMAWSGVEEKGGGSGFIHLSGCLH